MAESEEKFAFPASFAQRRLWFLDQIESGTAVYNVAQAFRLLGPLRREALAQALATVVERHEALRTTFDSVEGAPRQIVDAGLKVPLELVDLQALPADERLVAATERANQVARTGFDLTRGPLMRAVLVVLSESDHVLVFNVHHIVCDGWSLSLLFSELSRLYTAQPRAEPVKLPEQEIQYADYAIWQEETFQGPALESELGFWKEYLGGELPTLSLPFDRNRPATPSLSGGLIRFELNAIETNAARGFAAQERASLFMTLLAAFQVFLRRISGEEDVLVGSPIANRDREEVQGGIGFYTNTVVFRGDLSGRPSFRELLVRLRDRVLAVLAHQEVPLERVVEAVAPDRKRGDNPLFQVMFALQRAPDQALALEQLEVESVPVHSGTSKFDLLLEMQELDQGMQCFFEYNQDVFDEATAEDLAIRFKRLLADLVANPDQPISDVPLLTDAEREASITRSSAREGSDALRFLDLWQSSLEQHPQQIAAEAGGASISYGDLERRANALAHHLVSLGAGAETPVGVFVERGIELLIAVLGILKAGAYYLPLDPAFPEERIGYMLEDSGAPLVVTQRNLADDLPNTDAQPVLLDVDVTSDASDTGPQVSVGPDSLAYMIYTSGSTGRPKGVQIPQRALVNFLLSMQERPGLKASDRLLAVTTLSFDISVLELFLPLVVGATTVIAGADEVGDGAELLGRLEGSAISAMQATPATWQLLLEAGWDESVRLRLILCGGEAWPPGLARALLARGEAVWNMYGPTETTVWSTCAQVTDENEVLLGTPILGTSVQVVDRYGQLVPPGVSGELLIGGVGLARGYHQRDTLTGERFIQNPRGPGRLYRTGDRVKRRRDGQLVYLGRFDNQVKLRGFRIELGEIETKLSAHPKVRQAVAHVWQAAADRRLVAYVLFEPGQTLTSSEMRRFLRQDLPDYMIPQVFVEMSEFPMTANRKLDRRALPDPLQQSPDSGQARVEPRNPSEELVARLWSHLLKVERIGVQDNFYDLGGHSLLSTQFVYQLEKETGYRLSPRAVVFQSLAQIAAELPNSLSW